MTVYVYRDGKLVDKRRAVLNDEINQRSRHLRNDLWAFFISRFESYQSPVTEQTISSDRQRELDLFKSNSYDERDIGPTHPIAKAKAARKAENARPAGPKQPDFWR